MHTKTYRKIQALVLGATGLFLLQKIWSGSLYFYINERFLVLILLAALGFLILAQVLIADLFPQKKGSGEVEGATAFSDEIDLHQVEEHLPAHLHTHAGNHVYTPKGFPWILLVVALPVLLGILIPARPLGASAVANKGLRVTSPLRAGQANNRLLLEVPPNNRTILDWQQIVGSEPEPTRLVGETVDVVGFVYRDPRLPDGLFMVGRFTLTCCVADAFAIGMIVDSPEAEKYPENTWVRVQGTLDLSEIDGQVVPSILADKIQEVSEPAEPYLIQ